MEIIQILDPFFEFRTSFALIDGNVEEIDVRVQGKLVHRIDSSQIVEYEEEDGCTLSTRTISLRKKIENHKSKFRVRER